MNRRGFFASALGAVAATCGIVTAAEAMPVVAPEAVGSVVPRDDVEHVAMFFRRRRRRVIFRRRRRRF